MDRDRGLFIYRPLTPESSALLKPLQGDLDLIDTFQPVENLHLTLLNRNILSRIDGRDREDFILTGPATSRDTYEMHIDTVRFHQTARSMSRFAISLRLNSSDGHYIDEHKSFRERAEKRKQKKSVFSQDPHVTLGHLRPEFAIESILDLTESLIGQTLSFGPIESNIGPVGPPIPQPENSKPSKPNKVSSPTVIHVPVRTLSTQPTPVNFLTSLRRPSDISR